MSHLAEKLTKLDEHETRIYTKVIALMEHVSNHMPENEEEFLVKVRNRYDGPNEEDLESETTYGISRKGIAIIQKENNGGNKTEMEHIAIEIEDFVDGCPLPVLADACDNLEYVMKKYKIRMPIRCRWF
jgi:hypothetical protein